MLSILELLKKYINDQPFFVGWQTIYSQVLVLHISYQRSISLAQSIKDMFLNASSSISETNALTRIFYCYSY